ncbi:MAG: hypothetical protein LBK13_03240 [Spirochaetales bacterium]|jgi:hypothetical protein|nr:hypothetical protein [Spirochaetales bacterium]
MGKTILIIGETEYTVDNFTCSLSRPRGCPPGEVNYLSGSITITGKNNLDALMLQGPFNCVVNTYDESGALFKRLEFEGAEITSYSANAYPQACCVASIQLEAEIMRFDNVVARIKTDNE